MTLFPTHISLEGLLLWIILSPKDKEYFKENKSFFWLIIFFSILPDFDIFLGIHRGISHSLFSPLLLIIGGTMIYIYFKYGNIDAEGANSQKSKDFSSERLYWGKIILFCGLLWIVHIFLDLEYPLAIFYPLSDRLYQMNFLILIKMIPWFFLPIGFSGIGFDISSISYLRGITTYFINLSVEKRVEIYGTEPVSLLIDNYFIHFLLFVIFLFIVAHPMIPELNYKRLSTKINLNRPDGIIFGLGFILIINGLLMGPMIGPSIKTTDSITTTFQVSEEKFSPLVAITYETTNYLLQPNALETVHASLITEQSPFFNTSLILTNKDNYNEFVAEISSIFKNYPPNTSENIVSFESAYVISRNKVVNTSLENNHSLQNVKNLYSMLPRGSYAIVGIVEDWNSSLLLNGTIQSAVVQLKLEVTSNRETIYILGIVCSLVGIVIAFFSFKVNNKKLKSS